MSVNEIDTIATKMREPCVRLMQTNVALRSHAQTILLFCTHLKFLIQTVHFATKKKNSSTVYFEIQNYHKLKYLLISASIRVILPFVIDENKSKMLQFTTVQNFLQKPPARKWQSCF